MSAHTSNGTTDGPSQQDGTGGSRLFAAGFNAHGQLSTQQGDVKSFEARIHAPEGSDIRVLFAGWSSTVIVSGTTLFGLGNEQLEPGVDERTRYLRSAFGDHEGMLGCLDHEGHLYIVKPSEDPEKGSELTKCSNEESPLIGTIAVAQNRVALTFKQAPNGRLCHVAEFSSYDSFRKWFEDPSGGGNYPESHYMLPGRPKQLLANIGTCTLLMDSGEIYTWGDNRYQSLGRSITGEDAVPADKPGAMEALGGLQIIKVATGGWANAALSEDGALYVWGTTTPATNCSIDCLQAAGPGEVSLVEIPNTDGEPLDVLDVAVGDNHLAVVTEGGRLFIVGDNENGQLGLDSREAFISTWQEAAAVTGARKVFCGPKCTLALSEG